MRVIDFELTHFVERYPHIMPPNIIVASSPHVCDLHRVARYHPRKYRADGGLEDRSPPVGSSHRMTRGSSPPEADDIFAV